MAANLSTRRAFVRNLTTFLETHQLDGADLDWEHPKSKSEIESFQKLILELKTAFRPHDFELTVTVADWGQYLNPETIPSVDRIQVMAYDQGTPHASYEKAILSMNRWLKQGVPASKLIMGLPLYGRNKERLARSYAQIIDAFAPPPSSDLAGGFHFNGIDTQTRKIHFARDNGLADVLGTRSGCEEKIPYCGACHEDFSKQKKEVKLSLELNPKYVATRILPVSKQFESQTRRSHKSRHSPA